MFLGASCAHTLHDKMSKVQNRTGSRVGTVPAVYNLDQGGRPMEPTPTPSVTPSWAYPIVVGVDFQPLTDEALREAFRTAALHPGATVHAVHGITKAPAHARGAGAISETEALLENSLDKLKGYVSKVATAWPEAGGQRVQLHYRIGDPAEVLVQVSVDVNAELIVVATHGRHGLQKLALGSVASKLIEIARCPVMIVRARDYTGLTPTPTIEPVCPDCARVRRETGDVTLWCDAHRHTRPMPHAVGYSEVFHIGRSGGSITDGT